MTPLTAGVHTVSVFLTLAGCDSPPVMIDVTVNPLPPTPNPASVSFTDPTACAADDGTITLGGYAPLENYTVNYSFNGSPQVANLTSDAFGDLLII